MKRYTNSFRQAILLVMIGLLVPLAGFTQKKSHQQTTPNTPFTARVTGVTDGDTMEILYKGQPVKIRLSHIDSPEKRGSQPYGQQAKQALSSLCFGQQVVVYPDKYDRYRRLLATLVNARKQVVNQEMVRLGMAWHFKRYSNDTRYALLESQARQMKTGLWQDPNPVAPWEWRKQKHGKKARSAK